MLSLRPLAIALLASAAVACSPAPDPRTAVPHRAAPTAAEPVAAHIADTAAAHAEAGVAWETGDVDAAFAKARAERKPVFLYWGAVWCPPCNQVKATLFNRQDFIERSRYFVPVYVDGDGPSAQKLGARFKVSAYPTMILFRPDATEITRLPGEVDATRYLDVLALGMNGARPVRETLDRALEVRGAGSGPMGEEDWRMLAYYSWETDEQQLVAKNRLAPTLQRVAKACPAQYAKTAERLRLLALATAASAKDAKPHNDAAAREWLMHVAGDPASVRDNFDLVVYHAAALAKYVTVDAAARDRMVAALNAALGALVEDTTLSIADRLAALSAQLDLARIDTPKGALAPTLQQRVRDYAAKADREARGPYERQAVISAAADVLAEAGLLDESDAMLRAELARSHAPYYFMLGLAANAETRGDKAASLDWAQRAYAAAEGPATRLQWGTHYVNALIKLAPGDADRIAGAAIQVIGELDPTPDTFYERNRRGLDRMGRKLLEWNKSNRHAAQLQRVRTALGALCGKLPAHDASRTACDGILRPGQASSA
ncbi:MAG TPA: thioredoxin family protein [Casimicrobiaceae bacterium]|nr:thioredoxin family protein [Casimicrobiaceae bacterium]